MRMLCWVGLHRPLWMPVITVGDSGTLAPRGTSWIQVRRCVNCGRVVG